eukprot:9985435-Lingulodinium_polyedra.AAC.1
MVPRPLAQQRPQRWPRHDRGRRRPLPCCWLRHGNAPRLGGPMATRVAAYPRPARGPQHSG